MVDTLDIPEGVRLGNENLILVTAPAADKLCALIPVSYTHLRAHETS